MISIGELATYTVHPQADLRYDSHDGEYPVPWLELKHSICKQVLHSDYVSVSLVEVVQRALNHNKECT